MTPIALVLNLLLGALLIAALALGLRLDRRLKHLRDSQQGFIRAVADLDQAAARTQAGLNQWREAADDARELLHDRIEKAKVQTAKLEMLLKHPLPAPPAPATSRIAELGRRSDAPKPEPEVRDAEARAEAFAAMLTLGEAQRVGGERRPAVDDDLFEAPPSDSLGRRRALAAAPRMRQ